MADKTQFGNPKGPQFGDRISPGAGGFLESGDCAQCEAMLADALDGVLSPADQASFDAHVAICDSCSAMLADAKRGAAWLEMLRDPRPDPPAELLERILAQTTGNQQPTGSAAQINATSSPVQPVVVFETAPTTRSNILPFRRRFDAAIRGNVLGHAMLQPRLAMTAAMAFFSIALTLNLTGVHVTELRPGDLKPSSIKRDFYSANARMVQYYEGLRVVYELESRVHDLESESDPATGSSAAPSTSGPAGTSPAASPDGSPADPQGAPKPQGPRKSPGPGSSRKEDLGGSQRLLALRHDPPAIKVHVRERGPLA